MTEQNDNVVVVRDARLIFLHLFEPAAVMRNGKPVGDPKYSALLLLDEDGRAAVQKPLVKAAREKWPGRDLKEDIRYNRFNWPLTPVKKVMEQAEQKNRDPSIYEGGAATIKADSKFPPEIYDGKRKVDPNDPAAARAFYSGAIANVQLNVYAYDGVSGGSDGVKAYLEVVVKTRDGERLVGGGGARDEVFAGVSGGESEYDPTEGTDDLDDAPF